MASHAAGGLLGRPKLRPSQEKPVRRHAPVQHSDDFDDRLGRIDQARVNDVALLESR
jgi:hypothetical protein